MSKASSFDDWNSLFEFVKMVNIVGVYEATQFGFFNRWQAVAEDEFWLLDAAV